MLNETIVSQEPNIPFPQADSFERVVNLCELLNQKMELSKEEVTNSYDFDERQTNYYTDAARYLDLVEKKNENNQIIYFLSDKGKRIFSLPLSDRQIEFAKSILSHLVFKRTLQTYFDIAALPDKHRIVEIMKDCNLYRIDSNSTFYRRASTITSWVNWILNLIEE